MMLYKPTLLLKRLVIKKGILSVYDETFHKGVNIIRGENGSGKTTIIQAIIHVLGGDVHPKKDELLLCDFVYAETEINGKPLVFKRTIEVDENSRPGIEIYEGSYDEGIENVDNWTIYPNRRNENKKSYSQIIFSMLGLPEEKTENNSNITIHDVLRLLYEDQNTSADKIFQSPSFPESNSRRQAISDLLLGIDDLELHQLRVQLNEKEKLFSGYDGQLRQIYKVLGSSEIGANLATITAERAKFEQDLQSINNKIEAFYIEDNKKAVKEANKKFDEVKKGLVKIKGEISQAEEEQHALKFDIDDSKEFIISLSLRLDALAASTEVTKSLGSIEFNYCPSCMQIIAEDDEKDKCSLCKCSIVEEGRSFGYLKMQNEITFQKRESESILERKEQRLSEIELHLKALHKDLSNLERKNKVFLSSVSPIEAEIRTLIEQTGYLDKSIQDTYEREKLALKIEEIRVKKGELNNEISYLKDLINAAEASRETNRQKIYTAINDKTLIMLKNDPNPELSRVDRISFDFGKDEVIAVGKSSPAASTGTYLKNSFFFALFLVSLEKSVVRYPRFIIMDNIEDSGISTPRVRQFHSDIIAQSDSHEVVHQIIFTSRSEVLSPELHQSDLCVGDDYKDIDGYRSLAMTPRKRIESPKEPQPGLDSEFDGSDLV